MLATDILSRQEKINKKTVLHNTLDHMYLIDIYRTFHHKTKKYTLFSSANRTFSKIDHKLGHKTSLNKFKTEIMSSMFSDHNSMKMEIKYKRKAGRCSCHSLLGTSSPLPCAPQAGVGPVKADQVCWSKCCRGALVARIGKRSRQQG